MNSPTTKKTPSSFKPESVSSIFGQKPKVQGTLSNIPRNKTPVNKQKDILDDKYITALAESLRHYPPSVLGEFFARLIDTTALKQWDNGRIHKNIIAHLHQPLDGYEESDIIGQIKRKIYLPTYIARILDGSLKPSGRFQVGKCPFCNKKDKFWVSKNGCCNCFACQFPKSMDLINFYCRYHDVEVDEAVHQLAKEAGLDR